MKGKGGRFVQCEHIGKRDKKVPLLTPKVHLSCSNMSLGLNREPEVYVAKQ